MEPFQTRAGSGWDSYLDDSDGESEHYSSEDEIGEIEEALLQRIHYAEDCGEEFSSAPTEGTMDTFLHYRGDHVAQITFRSLASDSESTEIDSEKRDFKRNIPVKGDSPMTVKREKSLEPAIQSPITISDDSTRSGASSKNGVTIKTEGHIQSIHGSDSDSESKYKAIKSKKLSSKLAGATSDSVIEISSGSDERNDLSRGNAEKKNLFRSNVDIVSIDCKGGDSDVDSVSDSNIVFTDQIPESPETSGIKRQWRKSTEDPNIAAKIPKKVKLKKNVIDAELRSMLDEVEGSSSEDDLSDVMVIESHSEDEALDVNYQSNSTEGRGYNQSYERNRSRGRYYQEPEYWPRYKCYNCLEFGHSAKDCPKPRQRKVVTCVLCGTQGHSDRQCPDALCYVCSEPGHQARECPNKKIQYIFCRRCSMKGHMEQQCPDRWRQYHLTTEPGKIRTGKPMKKNQQLQAVNGKVFCYNCSQEGHFGHECWEEPMDRRAPLILPYVVRYDQIPRRFWKMQMDSAEPPETAREFNAPGPDAGEDSVAPSVPPKKESRKKKLKRLRAEQLAAMAEVGAAGAAKLDDETNTPSTSKKQGKKAKKRKLEPTESITADSTDHVGEPVLKKCRKKTKEEFAADEEQQEVLATLSKAERRRLRRRKKTQSRQESLERGEILSDYEETEDYIRKSGHILRRNDSVREAIAKETARSQVETQTAPAGKKKKKKPKLSKSEKRARKQYREEQKMQQQKQQVSFNSNFEQFPELEQKYLTPNQDIQQQQFHQDEHFNSMPAVNQSKGGKKNRRKPTASHKNIQGNIPQLNVPMPPDQQSAQPMSKRQLKKQQYYMKLKQKGRGPWKQKKGAGQSFMSERGFKVEPMN